MEEPKILLYLKQIWFKESIYKRIKNTILIMDAISHISENINKLFNQYNSNYILVTP